MKKEDYKTIKQAKHYHFKRFSKGLKVVDLDEMNLINSWLSRKSLGKNLVCLDLGTGTGRVVKFLLTLNPKKIYALDSSSSMLNYFQQVFEKQIKTGQIKILKSLSHQIPLEDSSVDLITSIHLFKHLKNIEPTLKEARRILKKNGLIIFDVLNASSLVKYRLGSCFALSELPLRSTLVKNGFRIKKIAYLHIFGETIYNLGMFPSKIIHLIDQGLANQGLKLATKIFILAQRK